MSDKTETKKNKTQKKKFPFTNRELSWLDFDARVLEEAYRKENPVLERLKFLAITASNMDEFFMVRVAGLKEQAKSGYQEPDSAGLTPQMQLEKIYEKTHEFTERQYTCLIRSIFPALRKYNIQILKPDDMNQEQRQHTDDYFHRILFPVLTPLAIDLSRPFPFLSNKSLNIAIRLKNDENHEDCFAVVQVPAIMPRLVELPCQEGKAFLLLEDLIIEHLSELLELHEIKAVCPFRITRNSDLSIDEEAEDLLIEIEKSIRNRKRGKPVRLEIPTRSDEETRKFLVKMLGIREKEIYECAGPLDLNVWMKFSFLQGFDELRLPPIKPATPADFWGVTDIFEAIREKDRLVHHPYESFDCVVNFIRKAAEDPDVLAIKQTLYRVSGNSPIIAALMKAAENGKQVTVLVELKARFDEENNIHWAKKLERAGCHVIYGLKGLKTHCKILLVVRRENDGIRRYVHMGTGNYNDSTARLYTDIGMFTCRESFGSDASSLFNVLTGYSKQPQYKKVAVAPDGLRPFFNKMIDREIKNAKEGLPSGITVKVNSLICPKIIKKLYDASNAGVKIRLIVRGICGLIPGVPEYSENITVISIVGQLLEHSRIFCFENAGSPVVYLGSADWMRRNLDRRIELIFPVEDPDIKKRVMDMLDLFLNDTTNARIQGPDGVYEFVDKRGRGNINCQLAFAQQAKEKIQQLEENSKKELYNPRINPEENTI